MRTKTQSKAKAVWTEIAVRIGPGGGEEAAEAAAVLLGRFGVGGAVIEERRPNSAASVSGKPTVRVIAYRPAGRGPSGGWKPLEKALSELRKRFPVSKVRMRRLAEEDWAESWKKGYTARKIGRRLLIHPSWKKCPAGRGRIGIAIDPGRAFGTGLHPTTRLCLIAVEKYLKPKDRMLDVGTGTGILSIAAARLGAGGVFAFDIEPEAAAIAQENAERNGVSDRVVVRTGTPESLSSEIPPSDLIAVNILAYAIIRMMPLLASKLLPGGHLVAGGILAEASGDLERALREAGLSVIETLSDGEWVSLVAKASARSER